MSNFVRKSCVSACLVALLACGSSQLTKPHRVYRQDLAGSTYVTVLSIAPWDDYAELLQPKFTLSVDDALAKAVPNTRDQDERMLQSISAAFKVSTPAATSASSETTSTSGAVTKTTTDRDATNIVHDTNVDATTLPTGTAALSTALDKEPMLQYLVATALYQEVQLLNSYVKEAAKRDNMVPYVVRLQVTLMPSARNEPYDAYSNISFFYGPPLPASVATGAADPKRALDVAERLKAYSPKTPKTTNEVFDDGLPCTNIPAPVISPLLVTDNLEGAIHGQTSEYVRQFLASVLLVQADYSGQATARYKSDLLKSVLGRDINSLLTVARVSDSTLRVRLGAVQAPTGSYAMVPQTHNVTILMMVPRPESMTEPCSSERTVRFVSKTTFVDAENGNVLAERGMSTEGALLRDVARKLDGYGVKVRWSPVKEMQHHYLNLVLFAATNNRQSFNAEFKDVLDTQMQKECLEKKYAPPCVSKFASDVMEDGVWSELVNLSTGGPYHIGTVELPKPQGPAFPEEPYDILLTDDGKAAATVSVNGCSKLAKGAVTAKLEISCYGLKKVLKPTSIEVADTGDAVKVTFPSPSKFLDNAKDAKDADYVLVLGYPKNPREKYDRVKYLADFVVPPRLIKYSVPDPEKPPAQPVTMTVSSTIVRSVDGEGKLTIEFERSPKATEVVRFDVVGGDIADVSAVPTAMLAPGRARTIAGTGIVTLSLRNLLDGQTLTISTRTIKPDGSASLLDEKKLLIHDTLGASKKASN